MDKLAQSWGNCLEYAAVTHVGMRRSKNQDSFSVVTGTEQGWGERGHLFVVADGMGAHAAGELASKMAVDAIVHHYQKYPDVSAPEALQRAILQANSEIHRKGQQHYDYNNMGTTASVLIMLPQGAVVGHVGDSRIYRVRGRQISQLTFDHSLVWELQATGQVSANMDVTGVIPKNVITRSLGPNETVRVDVEGPHAIAVGDVFLLCSDGLTGRVHDEELAPLIANLAPAQAAQVCVDLANLRGGQDNVTVIVARVTGPQIATESSAAEPLKIGGHEKQKRVFIPWVVAGVLFLVALILLSVREFIAAAVTAVAAVIPLCIGLYQQLQTRDGAATTLDAGVRLGKGPYVETICLGTKHSVEGMANIVDEITRAIVRKELPVDLAPWNEKCRQSESLGDPAKSEQSYCQIIADLLQHVRGLGIKRPGSLDEVDDRDDGSIFDD